ncbi:unnamed protein product [Brachionus calyciflorus]|uniref:Uncharacterized protein n=1 Tax=Brachionus calyciflorus TaxID=104777 RepID=A0A813ML06_9BILA|nr:unnamed protein product [Brachionus calyciflorus]
MESLCDYCQTQSELVITLPCSFQICKKHIDEQQLQNDNNQMINCLICNNHTYSKDECLQTARNQIRIKTNLLEKKFSEFGQRIDHFKVLKNDLKSLREETFSQVEQAIENRRNELEQIFLELIISEHNKTLQELDLVKQVYMREIDNHFSKIDLNSLEANFGKFINTQNTIRTLPQEKIKVLDDKIDDIDSKMNNLYNIEQSITKYKNLEFKKKDNLFSKQFEGIFGDIVYRTKTLSLKQNDLKSAQMSLDNLYGFIDFSNTTIQNFGEMIHIGDLSGHFAKITKVDQLPTGDIVSSSDDCTIKIWDKSTRECKLTLEGHSSSVKCFKILGSKSIISGCSAESNRVAKNDDSKSTLSLRGSELSSIIIWDVETGAIQKRISGPKATINCIELLDNDTLVTGDSNGYLGFWRINSGNCFNYFKAHDDAIYSILLMNQSKLIVSASADNLIKIWSNDCKQLLKTFNEHSEFVWCLSKVNEELFLSGSKDTTIKLWNIDLDSSVKTFKSHQEAVRSIKYLDDESEAFLSVSLDGVMIQWNLKSNEPIKIVQDLNQTVYSMELTKSSEHLVVVKDNHNLIKMYKSNFKESN